ncbi:sulfite exporter TauE/SafE family protein [Alphaproteobacteria bacterium]|nr:sulfite exporter TauE/SafE family protein [Alphaproteobacteria bacterium]
MTIIVFALIGFAAFFLKGITGTGTSTAIVAFCALLIDPKMAIVLAAFVNVWGGLYMLRTDPVPLKPRYWMLIAAGMAFGSVFGAWLLKLIDGQIFNIILGVVFLCVSFLFAFRTVDHTKKGDAPERPSIMDITMGYVAGFCGGFVGVNAPVLVGYFGHYLHKKHMRRLLILIFIPAAIVQSLTYVWNGLFSIEILRYSLMMVPGMIVGVYVGNIMFHKVSDILFKRILAVFLVFVSLKLIFS